MQFIVCSELAQVFEGGELYIIIQLYKDNNKRKL